MTEDDKVVADALEWARSQTPNKTDQAGWLAMAIDDDPRLRAAVARQLVARQVPLVGKVT